MSDRTEIQDQEREGNTIMTNTALTQDKKDITYAYVMELNDKLMNAPIPPKKERIVSNKKEFLEILRKSITAHINKGYSPKQTAEFLGDQNLPWKISEAEIKKLLKTATEISRRRKRVETVATEPTATDAKDEN